jgi:hypothetical protein
MGVIVTPVVFVYINEQWTRIGIMPKPNVERVYLLYCL